VIVTIGSATALDVMKMQQRAWRKVPGWDRIDFKVEDSELREN
jgi:hypothetical protein